MAAIGSQIGVAIQAAHLFADVLQRGEEARALYEIGLQIASVQDTQRILDSVVEHARRILAADVAALCLASAAGELTVAGLSGPDDAFLRRPAGIDPLPDVLGARPFTEGRSGRVCPVLAARYGPNHLASHLRIGETVIGDLCVSTLNERVFTERERELLDSLADMAAIAINNARLLEQERKVAVLEERSRLAREMHDSLAQVLAFLHMRAEATRRTLVRGDSSAAVAELAQLSSVAEDAYRDVREAILALRETMPEEQTLVGVLRGYVEKFARQSGVKVDVQADGAEQVRLPGEVEIQLMRVVQEALTNVRKHAGVGEATLRVRKAAGIVTIEIEDHGCGFDVEWVEATERQFGLHTMRERMERVGAALTIESAPGEGTTVRVTAGAPRRGGTDVDSSAAGRRSTALP